MNTYEDVTTKALVIREAPDEDVALKNSAKEGGVHECIANKLNVTMVVDETH